MRPRGDKDNRFTALEGLFIYWPVFDSIALPK